MEAEKYTYLGKICATIGDGRDVTDSDEPFVCTTNVVRIAGVEESYIRNQVNDGNNGTFIPEGIVEYFKVKIGDTITVVSGTVNITSIM